MADSSGSLRGEDGSDASVGGFNAAASLGALEELLPEGGSAPEATAAWEEDCLPRSTDGRNFFASLAPEAKTLGPNAASDVAKTATL
jgi:hypothetical protein